MPARKEARELVELVEYRSADEGRPSGVARCQPAEVKFGIERISLAAYAAMLALCGVMCAAGCGVTGGTPRSPVSLTGGAPDAARRSMPHEGGSSPPELVDPIISPSVLSEPMGLELRSWIVRDDMAAVRAALAPYLHQPLPVDAVTEERLRRSGLRLIAVPIADLLSLRSRLPILGRIDRRWVGQAPDWVEGVAGTRFAAGRTVREADELIRLGAGELRLLLRTWVEPQVGQPLMRMDLAIQHVEASQHNSQRSMLMLTTPRSLLAEGQVFRVSFAELVADGAMFFVLVPESPGANWIEPDNAAAAGDSQASGGGSAVMREEAPHMNISDAPLGAMQTGYDEGVAGEPIEPMLWQPNPLVMESQVQGPPALEIPTLGETLLIEQGSAGSRAMRAIVVLVPRLAGDSRLLP